MKTSVKKNFLNLNNLKLKILTVTDIKDYCFINNIKHNKIFNLNLYNNNLTDISGIKLFKNLEYLYLFNNYLTDISAVENMRSLRQLAVQNNQIKDISVIKNLTNLEDLNISGLELESNQIEYINSCNNLKILKCNNGFKDMSVINKLNNIKIII